VTIVFFSRTIDITITVCSPYWKQYDVDRTQTLKFPGCSFGHNVKFIFVYNLELQKFIRSNLNSFFYFVGFYDDF